MKVHRTPTKRPNCPTPRKKAYSNRAKANHGKEPGKHAYRCACGLWHLTSQKRDAA